MAEALRLLIAAVEETDGDSFAAAENGDFHVNMFEYS